MTSDHADTPQRGEPNVLIRPEDMAGVWANWARVGHSPYEFTLDFVRLDYSQAPPQGIVVARVSLSPLLVTQLIDALTDNWDKYAKKAMPREVQVESVDEHDDERAADPNGGSAGPADPVT